ncbi:hypothetical protein N2152v2_003903 [Parachlorella kessleri]
MPEHLAAALHLEAGVQQGRTSRPCSGTEDWGRLVLLCRRHPPRLLARAENEGGSSSGSSSGNSSSVAPPQEDGDLLIEKQLASKRRKPKEPKERPRVISAARDQVYGGGPLTGEQVIENRVVQALAVLFLVILAEGLFLGASGFLSESVDQFAQDVVYPLFSPSVGVFLLGSSGYGLWKTYFQGRSGAGDQK